MEALKELYKRITQPSTLIGVIIISVGMIIIMSDTKNTNISGKFYAASLLMIFGGIILTTNYLVAELKEGYGFISQLLKKSVKNIQSTHEKEMETLRDIYEDKTSNEKVKGYSSVSDEKPTEIQS